MNNVSQSSLLGAGKTMYGYQNRYTNGGPLASILPRLVRPPTNELGLEVVCHPEEGPGRLARGSRDITVRRHPAMPSHIVHLPCIGTGGWDPPAPPGQPLRSALWNTFLTSAGVRILFVAYICRRERPAVSQGMSPGPAGATTGRTVNYLR